MITTLFGDNLAYSSQHFGEDRVVSRLKEILHNHNYGDMIELDVETYDLIEAAVDEIESIRMIEDDGFDYDTVTDIVFEQLTSHSDLEKLRNLLTSEIMPIRVGVSTVDNLTDQIIDWHTWTIKELRAEADFLGLKTSGVKKEIVERLRDDYLKKNRIIV